MTSVFDPAYAAGVPPWDIGRPQPEFVRLAEAGEIRGDVLDVGCGTGENAMHLAGLGHRPQAVASVITPEAPSLAPAMQDCDLGDAPDSSNSSSNIARRFCCRV